MPRRPEGAAAVLSACLWLVSSAHCAPDAPGAVAPELSGYTLWRYAPPGWHWEPADTPSPVASGAPLADGGWVVEFRLPTAGLPGVDLGQARFGIAAGFTANGPVRWLQLGDSLIRHGPATPIDSLVFAQSRLVSAAFGDDGAELVAELTFADAPALESAWDLMGLVDTDGDASTGYRGAEWLLQNVPLGSGPTGGVSVPWLELEPGIAIAGREAVLTAWVVNDEPNATRVEAALGLPEGVQAQPDTGSPQFELAPGETRRLRWTVTADTPGSRPLRLTVTSGSATRARTRWITAVRRREPRREFQSAAGDWVLYPDRPTLQAGNSAPLRRIQPIRRGAPRRNLFGITAHLPRKANDEDPFVAAHAVDGDPNTCWASRWWRSAVPLEPEWLGGDLGRLAEIAEVRFLPAWRNGGVPAGLTVETRTDGHEWAPAVAASRYSLQEHPDGGPLRVGGLGWQCIAIDRRPARFVRLTASRLKQGATSFFCAPFEPFQFRIAEVVALDETGEILRPVAASASSTHAAWYNTPETVTRTWPCLLRSGVGLNRVGQWGDRTDWAAVEQTPGVYRIPAEVDRAITECHESGVDVLLGLCYGNRLYQEVANAPDFGPTWQRGHPFLQCAPTTPEAVDAFARYCGFMADHFRGRVRYFEIWNEENGWFFDDWARGAGVEQVRAYGRALKAAAQAVKAANPEALVVFGGLAGSSLDYPRIALEEGAGPLVDVFAFHPYGHPTPESAPDAFLTLVEDTMQWKPRPPEVADYEDEIAAFRRVLREHNPRMEIWADEMNWFAPGQPPRADMGDQSELSQAKYLTRFFALNAWLGCRAVWWSLYNANGVQEWALMRSSDLTPRPAWFSAQYTSAVLDDVRAARGVEPLIVGEAPDDLMVKPFRNGQGEVLIAVWRASPAEDACGPVAVTLDLPGLSVAAGEICDLLYGSRQRAHMEATLDGVRVAGLLVGDWPVVVRLRNGA